jgi:hypothetical protein
LSAEIYGRNDPTVGRPEYSGFPSEGPALRGSVSAARRISVWGIEPDFRHGDDDREVSAKLMTLCKRPPADTFPPPS